MPELSVEIVPVTPFRQNCAIIWETESKRGVVVDPGGDVAEIRAAIARLGVTVETILLTHGHIDHAGGAAELKQALGVPIEGPDQRDLFLMQRLDTAGREYGIPDARPVTSDRFLVEGDQVRIGSTTLDVLHCPGHTPGSVVFVEPVSKFAVVGDVLFRGSVGRSDFPYGDGAALIAAIRAKLLPLGDEYRFICGHGQGSTFGAERRGNVFLIG